MEKTKNDQLYLIRYERQKYLSDRALAAELVLDEAVPETGLDETNNQPGDSQTSEVTKPND
ncbi:MAG TPA: hypothetical protein VFN31_00635 [Candidatus Saccharimonadales bacterium]|nr:hypothetical protein [Candidatus Saccharimonadales bacterium]